MTQSEFVQKGAVAHLETAWAEPQTFYFVLLPKVTMLAVNAAIEVLRIANQLTGKELYRWYTATPDGNAVQGSNLMRLAPDLALADIPEAGTAFICAGVEPETTLNTAITGWIRRRKAHGGALGGLCTGAFSLAKAGVLDGRRFTLHWENQAVFAELFPDLQPSDCLVERDGGLDTCGGGTAALDLMLALVAERNGDELAGHVADMCLHKRPTDLATRQRSSASATLGNRNTKLQAAIALMEANIEAPLELDEIADQAGLSRRHMERLFAEYAQRTPSAYYSEIRLQRAYALLSGTNMTATEVCFATGFNNSNTFSKRFRGRYGVAPHIFRRSWQR